VKFQEQVDMILNYLHSMDFSVDAGVRKNLVSLDPDVERRSSDVDPDGEDIDNSRDSDVVDVVKEEREDTSRLSMPFVGGSIPSSKQNPRKTTSTTSLSSPIAKSATSTPATPYVNYVCTQCGADLTGHSMLEKGGKLYCAKPGCGYPARGEVPA
jgi:hypothetical protein